MVEAGYGRMVFVSSVSGLLAHPDHAPYAATKGGLNQLLPGHGPRVGARHGVTVNAVAPGYIETDLTRDHLDQDGNREDADEPGAGQAPRRARRRWPTRSPSSPPTAPAFITGHVLYVDGGRVLV